MAKKTPGQLLVVVLLAIYILLPIAVICIYSIAEQWYVNSQWWFPQKVGLKWFQWVTRQPDVLRAFWLSFLIALAVVVLTLVLCIPAAYVVGTRNFKGKDAFEVIGNIPQVIPAVAIGVGLLPIYSRMGLLNTFTGIVLAHTIGAIPYAFRSLTSAFRSVSTDVEEAARTLGASRWTVLKKIYVPMVAPGVGASVVFAFSWSLNEFVLTMLLGFPQIITIPVQVYQFVGGYYMTPFPAAVLSIFLLIPSLLAMYYAERFSSPELTVGGGR